MPVQTLYCNGVPCYVVTDSTFTLPSIRNAEPLTILFNGNGSASCTITPAQGETIDGLSSITIYDGCAISCHPNISNWIYMTTNFAPIVPSILSVGAMGYSQQSGGSVTQLTSITTAVTLNKLTGKITLFAHDYSNNDIQTFTLNNSFIEEDDIITVSMRSGSTKLNVQVDAVADGSCEISVGDIHNQSTGSISVILNFAIIKGNS
jgi:hypothetical protein